MRAHFGPNGGKKRGGGEKNKRGDVMAKKKQPKKKSFVEKHQTRRETIKANTETRGGARGNEDILRKRGKKVPGNLATVKSQ